MKVRPCKKGCGYPALGGRQFCEWHALMRESSDVQAAAATMRRLSHLGELIPRVSRALWPPGERWCSGCQSFVPLFYCSAGSRCKACSSMASHAKRLKGNYGIDAAEYDRILKLQDGRCAICRNLSRTIRFAVDHDHGGSGEVRGLLCKRCNHDLLGGGHDDFRVLWRAVEYLLFPPAQRQGPRPPREAVWEALSARLDLLDRPATPRALQPLETLEAPF